MCPLAQHVAFPQSKMPKLYEGTFLSTLSTKTTTNTNLQIHDHKECSCITIALPICCMTVETSK